MSIASVAGNTMDEQQIVEMLEKYESGGEGDEGFRQAMKLHLALLLQVVRNTDNLQGEVEALLRVIAKECP